MYASSTGFLSSVHGVTHANRALLSLMLKERYGGELPPREQKFKLSLQGILTREEVWWTRYIREIGQLICTVYPAGIVNEKVSRLKIDSEWASGFGKNNDKEGLGLILSIKKVKNDPQMVKEALEGIVGDVNKVGKQKNWIGGREGWGMAIDIDIKEVNDF
ncbi:hypothetical protein V499_00013 [Pseudogymnoascus sp. VKM F-103]|nr:hypothetical protein V499_00013 [Pseudogymnoascus sp. VKM F-103]